MPAKILVATPMAAFGELIRQSLQEVGSHQVEVTGSASDAVSLCDRVAFDLAILDSDLKELPISGLGQAVLERLPRVRLVVFPPDNNPAHPRLSGLPVLAYLNKPFYLPDLIETVERVLAEPSGAAWFDTVPIETAETRAEPEVEDLLAELAATAAPDPTAAIEDASGGAQVFSASEPAHPLDDPALAARRLARLANEPPIWGALLLRGGQVWAISGQITPAAAGEVAEALARQWEDAASSDLTRFLRLPSLNRQVMVYAARLKAPGPSGMGLAMVYENMLSFTRARSQSARISRELAGPERMPEDEPAEQEQQPAQPERETVPAEAPKFEPEPRAALEAAPHPVTLPAGAGQQTGPAPEPPLLVEVFEAAPSRPASLSAVFDAPPPNRVAVVEPVRAKVFPLPDEWDIPEGEDGPPVDLPPLFADVPPPDPLPYAVLPEIEPASVPHAWVQEASGEPVPAALRADLLDELPPVETREPELIVEPAQEAEPEPTTADEWLMAEPVDGEFAEPPVAIQPVHLPMETIRLPGLATTVLLADRLDPLSADVYNLAFTSILIPRFPSHFLTGDLATQLSRWFPQICLAYSWRLEGLSVRPDHIQWVVRIPPTTSPANLLKIIRQQTSQRIFDGFPRLREDNPSAEFWAPGYLILSGVQTIASDLLREFIRQTRLRQGIK